MSKSTATLTSLRALAENKADGVHKLTTFRVDPNLIKFEEGFNLRLPGKDFDEHVERLYNAMKAGAFIPPVDVTVDESGKILARDGHCRTLAARKLRKELPELTLECRQLRGNDADAVLHMLGTGTGGKSLSPLEAGLGYMRLVKMGLSSSEIAAKLGISRPTVDNGLTLAEAPREVQKMIMDGEVSATTVREAMANGKDGLDAIKEAVIAARTEEASKPAPKKGAKLSKKKKVTAKKLKGTPAEKKTKKRKAKDTAQPPVLDPENITVTIPRDVAQESVTRIKQAATASPELKQLAAILDTALI